MSANPAVAQMKRRLGRFGAGLSAPPTPVGDLRRELKRAEALGLGSLWTNEGVGGKESMSGLALMLGATDELVIGSAIANIWARHPAVLQAGAATLAEAYPGRLALGVGVSHRFIVEASGQTFGSPLRTQREYLERMRASSSDTVRPAEPFPTIVGAIGPRMMELARDHADGAVPSSMPVGHTRWAREVLGPDKLLVVGVSVIPETDVERARAIARESPLLQHSDSPQQRALAPFGYSAEEVASVSDRLVDDTHAYGTPEQIAQRAREHLDAGADHVIAYAPFGLDLAAQIDVFEAVTPALSTM